MTQKSIPDIKMPEAAFHTFQAFEEPLVDIAEFSGGKISADMKYFEAKRNGAVNKAYVRKSVAEMLIRAQELLPSGLSLKIYDAWRPFEVQKDIYDEYYKKISTAPENSDKSTDELHALTRTFVSYPDKEKKFSYVHSSGGAVDLTITDSENNELDMGCGFDDFSVLAHTNALENTDLIIQRNNRRLLYNCMIKAGFTNYPFEWWHFDYRDLFWSTFTKDSNIYPSIYSIK